MSLVVRTAGPGIAEMIQNLAADSLWPAAVLSFSVARKSCSFADIHFGSNSTNLAVRMAGTVVEIVGMTHFVDHMDLAADNLLVRCNNKAIATVMTRMHIAGLGIP